jgi:hypothetical protein
VVVLVLEIGHRVCGDRLQFKVLKIAVFAISVIPGVVSFDVEVNVMLRLGR